MSIRFFALALLSFVAANLPAQTKWIAHKSHSGSDAHFRMIEPHSPFDDEGSDFGKAPEPMFKSVRLDTVIFISDSVVVLISSEYYRMRANDRKKLLGTSRDTVSHHPLFSAGYSLKEIKRRLKKEQEYENGATGIKFIGYKRPGKSKLPQPPLSQNKNKDKAQQQGPAPSPPKPEQQKQDNFSALIPAANYPQQPHSGFSSGLMISLIACFALLTGFVSWLRFRFRRYEKLV